MIVPLTREIMSEYYPTIDRTVRGFAEVEGDEVLGVSGVYISQNTQVAFAKFSDELKRRKRRLLVLAYATISLFGPLVFAVADKDIDRSENFLAHMGFEPYRGDIWVRSQR